MNRNKTKFNAAVILLLSLILLILTTSISVCAEDECMNQAGANPNENTTYTIEADASNQASTEVYEAPNNEYASGENSTDNAIITPENTKESISSGDNTASDGTNQNEGGDYGNNLFEKLYRSLELNADKIFSVLAFIGTLLVGVGYKSGLLPLLRENLSRLKGTIDLVKADGEESKAKAEEKFTKLTSAIQEITDEIKDMKGGYKCYKEMNRQKESLRLILEGQIDMLYAIFMTSALPQYQKDEIGERINRMREELKIYESDEEN